MKTIILGVGNPVLGDDSVGLHVARALCKELDQAEATVMETSVAGMDFLELLAGYDRAIIVDAIQTRGGKAGEIYRLELEAFEATGGAGISHNLDFVTAIELGRKLNISLPRQIVIYAIEVKDVDSYSEDCTPEVRAAIPNCTGMLVKELSKNSSK